MKKNSVVLGIIFFVFIKVGFSQIPLGYYNSAAGKHVDELRIALSAIIDNHTIIQYGNLWSKFPLTDKKTNGKVWDVYSDKPSGIPAYEYTFTINQCGNSAQEGDCYNREHSFPKSWFNAASPMFSDLFHIYPVDGFINNMRSNFPYGETNNPIKTSTNGGKLGPSSLSGYSGTVFEPIDEYKGDLARTYFYMLTRYMNQVSGWNSDVLQGNNFSVWAINLFLTWNNNDPVSQKEIDRNNAIYQIQGNRNPYIDSIQYVQRVWGFPTAVEAVSGFQSVKIYPNPLKNEIRFENLNNLGHVITFKITSLEGKLILQKKSQNLTSIALTSLTSGVYFISLQGEKGSIVRKFIKE